MEDFKNEVCFFFIRGCDTLNLTKAKNAIPNALELADINKEELEFMGLYSGFIGPYALKNITNAKHIYFSNELENASNLICGANERDYHFVGVNLGEFDGLEFRDLIEVAKGDLCVHCKGELSITKGIEIGHIFKLGDKYSKPLDATFLDKNGKKNYFEMGCYGIGISRIIPAILEQKADDKGAVWGNVAPFELVIIISNMKNNAEIALAQKFYDELLELKCEVLLDERDLRFGVKMGDFELIGIKFALIIGKGLGSNKIELVKRETLEKIELDSNITSQILLEQIRAS